MLPILCHPFLAFNRLSIIAIVTKVSYTCMCIVCSIGWSIWTLTGTKPKSMPFTEILCLKILNFHMWKIWHQCSMLIIAYTLEEINEVYCSHIRKICPQFMWGFQSQWAFCNTQSLSRDLMALSDDGVTMSNFFSSCFNASHDRPSLEVSLLQGALMKFSLRCVISLHILEYLQI